MADHAAPRAEPQHQEQLHQFVHDVKHCLHVIGMGTEILKGVRDDDARFAEICAAMEAERGKALQLLNDFLKDACKGCG